MDYYRLVADENNEIYFSERAGNDISGYIAQVISAGYNPLNIRLYRYQSKANWHSAAVEYLNRTK